MTFNATALFIIFFTKRHKKNGVERRGVYNATICIRRYFCIELIWRKNAIYNAVECIIEYDSVAFDYWVFAKNRNKFIRKFEK